MDDSITGYAHLDKIADEIGDEAGTCDADYAFQRAAAQMIYGLRNALEDAEANVARLTKERDWLANKLIDCPPEFTNCAVDCAECRKEAASRAVADSEVE